MKEKEEKEKMTYIRKDIKGNNWCSAEYMANKIGLPVDACTKFLNGPEFSEEHALLMTFAQAELFGNSLLTKEAEDSAN